MNRYALIPWLCCFSTLAGAVTIEPYPGADHAKRTLPFVATVAIDESNVRLSPDANSPTIGLVRRGADVTVTACVPDCVSKEAWALLGEDAAVRFSILSELPSTSTAAPSAEDLWYGRINRKHRRIYAKADLRSRVLDRRRLPQELAFLPDAALKSDGWLERVEGGFVRARDVTMLIVAPFAGEQAPALPLAFVRHPLTPGEVARSENPTSAQLKRYDRLPLQSLAMNGTRVVTEHGILPRRDLSVIERRVRPDGIPLDAKWVRVDLSEQTLTAYEGDMPVFATLVSTGKRGTKTHVGLFKLEDKLIYSDMHGEADDPYTVDRVPYVVYFDRGAGLHGTYWHDGFGARASHGCVNLSFADAKWIFDWAPPELPANWTAINANAKGAATLWVLIDR